MDKRWYVSLGEGDGVRTKRNIKGSMKKVCNRNICNYSDSCNQYMEEKNLHYENTEERNCNFSAGNKTLAVLPWVDCAEWEGLRTV